MTKPEQTKGKPFPIFTNDGDAEHFLDTADLSEYDFSEFRPSNFELRKKDARINMRVPQRLLSAIKIAAVEEQVPYQRLMREMIETGLAARVEARKAPKKKAS